MSWAIPGQSPWRRTRQLAPLSPRSNNVGKSWCQPVRPATLSRHPCLLFFYAFVVTKSYVLLSSFLHDSCKWIFVIFIKVVSSISQGFRTQTLNLTFLMRHRLSTTASRSTPTQGWSSEGLRQRIWKSEGKVARVARPGWGKVQCLSAPFPWSSSSSAAAAAASHIGLVWRARRDRMHIVDGDEDERQQTPTAVNIVLLKNRTLVSVFERVRKGAEKGWDEWLSCPPSLFVYSPG